MIKLTPISCKILAAFLLGCHAARIFADPSLLGAYYRADVPFPQYMPFWRESWSLKNLRGETLQYAHEGMPIGGSVHVFVRDDGKQPLEIDDVLLEGVSLKRAVAFSEQTRKRDLHPASIYFAALTKAEGERLVSAGEPVWWRVDPQPIPPTGTAEVFVRLRRSPQKKTLQLKLKCGDLAMDVAAPVGEPHPRLAGISFSRDLRRIYAYLQTPKESRRAPARILLDGKDLTRHASVGFDAKCDIAAVVVPLKEPLSAGSFHCLKAEYGDGDAAIAGLRAWSDDFAYGIWGYGKARKGDATQEDAIRRYLTNWRRHNINVHMGMSGRQLNEFLKSNAGRQFCASLGLRLMTRWPGKTDNPFAYFLLDEPDCGDYRVDSLKPHLRVGSLAQALVQRSREIRKMDPHTPHLLNVDLTYKPDNWYIYGQLPDILAADPYYQERLRSAYWEHPDRLPLYTKATYVYAVARVCQSACAPKPLHIILNSVRHTRKDRRFRFATPEEKRIEAYYALAAGAKGISYWWYTPIGTYYGCGADDPEAAALWREIGLLGAEARTVGSVVVRSCPASLPVTASRRLWVRLLIAGLDTLVVICVNDDYANDRTGTVVQPLERAEASIELPSWLEPKDVFEVTNEGAQDISWEYRKPHVALRLGKVELTRLILISSDIRLRSRLQSLRKLEDDKK